MKRLIPLLTLLLLSISCQQSRITHVVVLWLKEPGNEAARQQLIDESLNFRKIPGIVEVSAGRPIPTTRPINDASFDVAVVMKFKDEQALKDYSQHPIHLQAVQRTLLPLVARYVIYDYRE